jgi:hypothetical protein
MSIISVTITESVLQVLAGIPKTITLNTNVPASIFYTLDGTDPDYNSNIYVSPITMPTNTSAVVLKVFATDGTDTSAIISQRYVTTLAGARQTHDTVVKYNQLAETRANIYPFGGVSQTLPVIYGSMGGIIVDDPNIPNIPDGYDGTATGTSPGGTDLPLGNYDLIYSDSDAEGNRGHGIGTLPATVTIRVPPPVSPSSSSNVNDKFFNSKAMVIYQDSRDTPIDPNVPVINRQFFSLENPETVRTGALLFNTALDGLQPTGSFVRSVFNPADQTITYYYMDASVNRWIISKEPYSPKNSNIGNYANITFSPRGEGSNKIYKWIPFKSSRLI